KSSMLQRNFLPNLEEFPGYSSSLLQFYLTPRRDKDCSLHFLGKIYDWPYKMLLEHMINNGFSLRGNFDCVELLLFSIKKYCRQISALEYTYISLSFNLNVNDALQVRLSSSVLGFSALEDIDADRVGDRESNASEGKLRATRNQMLPSASAQGEGLNRINYDSNIPDSSIVEDRKVLSAQGRLLRRLLNSK
ncbi:hypothetical protein KI387_010652, partial [Taxus chinensis]